MSLVFCAQVSHADPVHPELFQIVRRESSELSLKTFLVEVDFVSRCRAGEAPS